MKKGNVKPKKKICKAGWECGKSCISRKKTCRKTLASPQAKQVAAGYVQMLQSIAAGDSKAPAAPVNLPSAGGTRSIGGGNIVDAVTGGGLGPTEPKKEIVKMMGDPLGKKIGEAGKKNLGIFENAYRGMGYEGAAAVNKDGKVVFLNKGDPKSKAAVDVAGLLDIPRAERANIVVTHNHPAHSKDTALGKVTADGGPFSKADFAFSAQAGMGGIRAASQKYNYTMMPKEGGQWPSKEQRQAALKEFDTLYNRGRDAIDAQLKKNFESMRQRGASQEEMRVAYEKAFNGYKEAAHKAWEFLSKKYDFQYYREEI